MPSTARKSGTARHRHQTMPRAARRRDRRAHPRPRAVNLLDLSSWRTGEGSPRTLNFDANCRGRRGPPGRSEIRTKDVAQHTAVKLHPPTPDMIQLSRMSDRAPGHHADLREGAIQYTMGTKRAGEDTRRRRSSDYRASHHTGRPSGTAGSPRHSGPHHRGACCLRQARPSACSGAPVPSEQGCAEQRLTDRRSPGLTAGDVSAADQHGQFGSGAPNVAVVVYPM